MVGSKSLGSVSELGGGGFSVVPLHVCSPLPDLGSNASSCLLLLLPCLPHQDAPYFHPVSQNKASLIVDRSNEKRD